mmetsp:Transcript_135679/g.421521  ORF Transcript_135679/g.421521 Transcript_135679/m.421521 type:complete len:275 (+) Transcript_135679:421-1245(+)
MDRASFAAPSARTAAIFEVCSEAPASNAWTSSNMDSTSPSGRFSLRWRAQASRQSLSASMVLPPPTCSKASSCKASAWSRVSPNSRTTSSSSSAASSASRVVCFAACMRAMSPSARLSPCVSPASWKSSCASQAADSAPERSFSPNCAEATAMQALPSSRRLPVFWWMPRSVCATFSASRKVSVFTQRLLMARRAETSSSRSSASLAISRAALKLSRALELLLPPLRWTSARSCISLISPTLSPRSLSTPRSFSTISRAFSSWCWPKWRSRMIS